MEALGNYLKRNWYVVILLLLAVCWGILKGDGHPWKDWEEASVVITIIYAIIVYVKLSLDKDVNKGILALSFPAIGLIGFASLLSVIQNLNINGYQLLQGSRTITMGCLFFGSLTFCIVDGLLSRSGSKYQDSFAKSLKFSDIPVTIAFLILWFYSWRVGCNPELCKTMDPFFGGAVAFQMMLSNVVWSFTDDAIFETKKSSNNIQQTTK